MQIALDELLKTKGKKSALDELLKINGLRYFPNSIMKVKEIAREIGSAVHAKPRLERWRGDGLSTHSGQDWCRVACGFENIETRGLLPWRERWSRYETG